MMSLRGVIVALVAALLAVTAAHARTGLLDRQFGHRGLVRTDLTDGADGARAVVVQPDGRIVVAGHAGGPRGSDLALARYTPAGLLDPTFGHAGKVVGTFQGDDEASAVALTSNGGVLVAGSTASGSSGRRALLVARFTPDGALDRGFGTEGRVVLEVADAPARARGVVVAPDGSAVLVGSAGTGARERFLAARLDDTGRLVSDFGKNGIALPELEAGPGGASAGAFLEDGEVVLAGRLGRDMAVVLLDEDGDLDESFGDDGVARIDFDGGFDQGRAVVVQPDGQILVGGTTSRPNESDFALARIDDDGDLDGSFAEGGLRRTDLGGVESGHAIALRPDGTIIVAGQVTTEEGSDVALAAYRADGTLDRSFGHGGRVRTDLQSTADSALALALQADGGLIAAGGRGEGASAEIALVRYRDGEPECGDGFTEGAEVCDAGPANGSPSSCCTLTCTFRPATDSCRPAVGLCDQPEMCSGDSATCPADEIRPADFACRPTAGWCDLPEACSGVSKQCPEDRVRGPEAVCRSAVGACDAAESCDGESAFCPADEKSTRICRPADGDCDAPEVCDGESDHCPGDELQQNGNACYDRNPCTVDEVCHEGECIGGTFDAFKCAAMLCRQWRVAETPNDIRGERMVRVKDGIEDGDIRMAPPVRTHLCARASLTGEAWPEVIPEGDPLFRNVPPQHRVSIPAKSTSVLSTPRLVVSDRFGRRPVAVAKIKRWLSVPARITADATEDAFSYDPRKCYQVTGQRSQGAKRVPVWVGQDPVLFNVNSLVRICLPATVEDQERTIVSAAVACYGAKRSKGEPRARGRRRVEVEAQRPKSEEPQPLTLAAGDREFLCFPAEIEPGSGVLARLAFD